MAQPRSAPPPAEGAGPVVGVLWMVITGILFVGVTAVVKHLGGRIPAAEAAFLRYALGLLFLLPMLPALRAARLDRRAIGLFSLRGAAHTLGVVLWFFAMTRIPIAEVTAMNYLSPVYVTLGAALFLGERLAARRIIAVVCALIGALIVLRPGVRALDPGHIAMLGTAVFFAMSYLVAKVMADRQNPTVVVAMLSITVTIGLAPLAALNWVTPTLIELAWLMLVAVLATCAHLTMTLAFRAAPVTVTQPVTFLQLVWASALGWAVFDEGLDGWVILGGVIILGSVSFITWREAMMKRRATRLAADHH
ncbi:DMT family transporter [Oceaniglobus trochenteri]|uniref:DMT family transporter n=1 Tax=Oceaniglobus trochenteri TaxID=2763260 RepID=UPI001CFF8650|nr:DMT family transporter [Oceaniglobus trochenteri]